MDRQRDAPADGPDINDAQALRAWLRRRDASDAFPIIERIQAGPEPIAWSDLARGLSSCPDPKMALSNFERFRAALASRVQLGSILRRRPRALESILQLFGTSQFLSDLMIADPAVVDWLVASPERYDPAGLFELLWSQLVVVADDAAQLATIRNFRHRQLLRIGYNDIVRDLPIEVITADLAHLADACLEGATRIARARFAARHGEARAKDGRPLRFVTLALGKLGGEELNYSSDIDLIFLYESDGQTSGLAPVTNAEFFSKIGSEIIRILSSHTPLGQAYRVDMRLRPEGAHGALARSLESTIGYYETSGRTWERQALIKCRPSAGDLSLGREFIDVIAPFVYRQYLSAAEIAEIKALKRRIESRTQDAGEDQLEVKTGRGGIRDVEFVVQFLQLLHGGADIRLRSHNTLLALHSLEQVGCVNAEERAVMDDTYRFLRRVEHRLQMLYDLQTHSLPRSDDELRLLALRLGYDRQSAWEHRAAPAQRFLYDYRAKTDRNRRILNHLLHDAFEDDAPRDADTIVNLVLDPDPTPAMIAEAFAPFPFRSIDTAYGNLMALAHENIEFLSQPRCRHFLAAIAPSLLRAVANTPDPDLALTNLERVSASLGAKAILWELFSMNPPSLRLYVELCAHSQFLSEILINNPGMIDDLIDSLVFDRPASSEAIREELSALCRGAEELTPILLGFRNKEWLRIGTRDILAREPIRKVTRELSDVAEAIVHETALAHWRTQRQRVGKPVLESDEKSRWAIIALGKLGGRELMYYGDLDLLFVYEGEGAVDATLPEVSNARFFANLAQQIIRTLSGGDGPPLYNVDTRLRPHGASGPLAVPLAAFDAYFRTTARPWELLALSRARVVFAIDGFGEMAMRHIHAILRDTINPDGIALDVKHARDRRCAGSSARNLKRGPGGMVDIEFIAQYLQLAAIRARTEPLKSNTWEALAALRRGHLLSAADYKLLRASYDAYRTIESRLQTLHNQSDVTLPESRDALVSLARRVGSLNPDLAEDPLEFESRLAKQAQRVSDVFANLLSQDDAPRSASCTTEGLT